VSRLWSWIALAGGSLLCACSSDDEPRPGGYEAGLAALCDGLQDGYERCKLTGQRRSYCGYDPVGVDGSALAYVGDCLRSDAHCVHLGSDQPAETCFEAAAGAAPLRQTTVDYCESASLNYFRCNGWWAVDDCLSQMRLWNDATLRDAMTCHDLACDALPDCEKAAFESPS
jgi:hypothetical protein